MNTIFDILRMVFCQAYETLLDFLWDDMPVMSKEAQRIFAHKGDRQKYIDAVEELKTKDEVTIELHTGEKITLINH